MYLFIKVIESREYKKTNVGHPFSVYFPSQSPLYLKRKDFKDKKITWGQILDFCVDEK